MYVPQIDEYRNQHNIVKQLSSIKKKNLVVKKVGHRMRVNSWAQAITHVFADTNISVFSLTAYFKSISLHNDLPVFP